MLTASGLHSGQAGHPGSQGQEGSSPRAPPPGRSTVDKSVGGVRAINELATHPGGISLS